MTGWQDCCAAHEKEIKRLEWLNAELLEAREAMIDGGWRSLNNRKRPAAAIVKAKGEA